jgi:hypothetical protein
MYSHSATQSLSEFFCVTEPFSPNALPSSTNAAAVAAGVSQTGSNSISVSQVAEQISFQPGEQFEPMDTHQVQMHNDWQPNEEDLIPSFGVERARELLMWLINLELRLPPYSEVSPA